MILPDLRLITVQSVMALLPFSNDSEVWAQDLIDVDFPNWLDWLELDRLETPDNK